MIDQARLCERRLGKFSSSIFQPVRQDVVAVAADEITQPRRLIHYSGVGITHDHTLKHAAYRGCAGGAGGGSAGEDAVATGAFGLVERQIGPFERRLQRLSGAHLHEPARHRQPYRIT